MAAKKPTYWELLQHPLWQKKRLEMLSLAQFTCETCQSTDKTLHVHHSYYEKGLAPWEYPADSLHVLCVDCHAVTQDRMTELHRQIGKVPLGDMDRLIGYAMGLEAMEWPNTVLPLYTVQRMAGVADAWGLAIDDIAAKRIECTVDGYALLELADRKRERK